MYHDILIKALCTKRYKIELFQTPNDAYVIKYENNSYHGVNYSEIINDYKIASELFDMKTDELEGI